MPDDLVRHSRFARICRDHQSLESRVAEDLGAACKDRAHLVARGSSGPDSILLLEDSVDVTLGRDLDLPVCVDHPVQFEVSGF
jgi:hypothetical protein